MNTIPEIKETYSAMYRRWRVLSALGGISFAGGMPCGAWQQQEVVRPTYWWSN